MRVAETAVCALAALLFAFTFGVNYGFSNHNTYLIHGLQLADPDFLSADWLTSRTTDYHPFFSRLVSVLARLGILVPGVAAANVVVIAFAVLAIYGVVRMVAPGRGAPAVFLVTLGLMNFSRTSSVASTYAFTFIFQPSTLAAGALIAAMLFFLRGRYAVSGLYLGLGGLFHVNVLVISLPLFFICHLFAHGKSGTHGLPTRLVFQLGPATLALLPHLPLLLANVISADAPAAREILMTVRGRHHYQPLTFLDDFVSFAIWTVLGLASLLAVIRDTPIHRRLAALFATLQLMVWSATALTTLVYVPTVAHLFFWRLAPFAVILAQLLTATAVYGLLREPVPGTPHWYLSGGTRGRLLAAAFAAGSVLLLAESVRAGNLRRPGLFLVLIVALCAVALVPRLASWLRRRTLFFVWPPATAYLLLVLTAWPVLKNLPRLPAELRGPQRELFDWAGGTERDALFLVPPLLERFRLHAGRAIVVDWKSPPMKADEIVEWYRRIEVVTARPRLRRFRDVKLGYNEMDGERFGSLKREFGFDYAVLEKPASPELASPDRVVFENAVFVVVRPP